MLIGAVRVSTAVYAWYSMLAAPLITGKLKELGNAFLGNFGMSLDKLQTKKDPETGAYNISFG